MHANIHEQIVDLYERNTRSVCLLLTIVVLLIDFITGLHIRFPLVFVLPVGLSAWKMEFYPFVLHAKISEMNKASTNRSKSMSVSIPKPLSAIPFVPSVGRSCIPGIIGMVKTTINEM